MKHLINPIVQQTRLSIIREISNMACEDPNAINLTVGQPDFFTPEHIKVAGKRAIDENHTQYTNNKGLVDLRRAASDFMRRKYQLSYDPEQEIIVTNGATAALDITFRTILEEGSEVLLPAPIYPGYAPLIKLCGAVPVYIDTAANNFVISAELIRKNITAKTRCVVLSYPSNPTGSILEKEALGEIAKLLADKDIFILADEIYSELTYGEKHVSIASFAQVREKTIVINGISKSHAMTGWRIGLIFAPEYLAAEFLKVHQSSATCACSISQYAALEALTQGIDDADKMKKEYQARRDYVFDRLIAMGLEVVKPMGAFYIFPSIKKLKVNSYDFTVQMLKEAKVAVVPGMAFSEYGEGYIRISYAALPQLLEAGLDRMEQFVRTGCHSRETGAVKSAAAANFLFHAEMALGK